MSWGRTDSRDYITPFTMLGSADIPADFHLPPELPEEFSGVFLPQESARIGLNRCPPHVLIVANSILWILTRRSVESTCVPLPNLEALECGRILLLGWICFRWNGSEEVLRYNRHGAATVERFLSRLKVLWLAKTCGSPRPQSFGDEPDLKFCYATSAELLMDEKPVVQFFHPSACRLERRFGFRHETRLAGDLLMLSDRRLLWITDRYRSAHDPYGTVSRSTPLSAIVGVRSRRIDSGTEIEIALRSGTAWRVPLDEGRESSASAFAGAASHVLAAIARASADRSNIARPARVELHTR